MNKNISIVMDKELRCIVIYGVKVSVCVFDWLWQDIISQRRTNQTSIETKLDGLALIVVSQRQLNDKFAIYAARFVIKLALIRLSSLANHPAWGDSESITDSN